MLNFLHYTRAQSNCVTLETVGCDQVFQHRHYVLAHVNTFIYTHFTGVANFFIIIPKFWLVLQLCHHGEELSLTPPRLTTPQYPEKSSFVRSLISSHLLLSFTFKFRTFKLTSKVRLDISIVKQLS